MEQLLQSPEFWVAVAFVIFMVFAAWKVRGPIVAALDERAAKIRQELDEAERLRIESQQLLAEYKRKQRDAVNEVAEMLDRTEKEAKRLRERAEADLDAALARRKQQALDRIEQAEADALAEVRNTAVDIAVEAARKLLAENLDKEKAGALVDEAVRDLAEKLH